MIVVRKAERSDLKELQVLFAGYREFYSHPSEEEKELAFLKERLEKNDSVIFIATEDLTYLGFVQLYPIFSSVKMRRVWLLNDLYVSPKARGKGVGKLLIEKCQELCRIQNARGLILETEKNNKVGNKLYPKMGFKLADENHYYWEKDES